ncbi:hypothetical protein PR048_028165 [Dryococelus australis]|uniref:Uncharacterized protein n=1 Tax=Dryococelus australis TaxID=614101 RepID=A0ABQ9GII2_9NEOP|nr:hypothetical protein PR048_028165 [Dryococelus australis]
MSSKVEWSKDKVINLIELFRENTSLGPNNNTCGEIVHEMQIRQAKVQNKMKLIGQHQGDVQEGTSGSGVDSIKSKWFAFGALQNPSRNEATKEEEIDCNESCTEAEDTDDLLREETDGRRTSSSVTVALGRDDSFSRCTRRDILFQKLLLSSDTWHVEFDGTPVSLDGSGMNRHLFWQSIESLPRLHASIHTSQHYSLSDFTLEKEWFSKDSEHHRQYAENILNNPACSAVPAVADTLKENPHSEKYQEIVQNACWIVSGNDTSTPPPSPANVIKRRSKRKYNHMAEEAYSNAACQLRKITDVCSQIIAKHRINQILFEMEMPSFTYHSNRNGPSCLTGELFTNGSSLGCVEATGLGDEKEVNKVSSFYATRFDCPVLKSFHEKNKGDHIHAKQREVTPAMPRYTLVVDVGMQARCVVYTALAVSSTVGRIQEVLNKQPQRDASPDKRPIEPRLKMMLLPQHRGPYVPATTP